MVGSKSFLRVCSGPSTCHWTPNSLKTGAVLFHLCTPGISTVPGTKQQLHLWKVHSDALWEAGLWWQPSQRTCWSLYYAFTCHSKCCPGLHDPTVKHQVILPDILALFYFPFQCDSQAPFLNRLSTPPKLAHSCSHLAKSLYSLASVYFPTLFVSSVNVPPFPTFPDPFSSNLLWPPQVNVCSSPSGSVSSCLSPIHAVSTKYHLSVLFSNTCVLPPRMNYRHHILFILASCHGPDTGLALNNCLCC